MPRSNHTRKPNRGRDNRRSRSLWRTSCRNRERNRAVLRRRNSIMSQKIETLLAIVIGYKNTVVGLLKEGKLIKSWRLTTVRERTSDEHGILIRNLLSLSGYLDLNVDGIAISCVVPPLLPSIKEMSTKYFEREPFIVQP